MKYLNIFIKWYYDLFWWWQYSSTTSAKLHVELFTLVLGKIILFDFMIFQLPRLHTITTLIHLCL